MARRIHINLPASTVAALITVGACGISLPCSAQSAPYASLVVTRGDGAQDCPSAEQLAQQVRAVAGRNVVEVGLSTPTETWIQVSIAHGFGGYSAQISTLGARRGTRLLEDLGPSCTSLADAIAVTIAIFLDPYANLALPTAPTFSRESKVTAPPRVAPIERRARFPELLLTGSGGIALNVLAQSEPLLSASVGMQLTSRWALILGGAFVFPDSTPVGGGQIDLGLSYAYVAACARAWGTRESAHIDWCGAPLLGSLAASGKGYREIHSTRSTWFALATGPEVVFRISPPLSWVVSAQGVVPLAQQRFTVQSAGVRSTAFHVAAVSGLLSLGVRGTW